MSSTSDIEVANYSSIKVPDRSGLLVVEQKDWDRIKSLIGRAEAPSTMWQNFGYFTSATCVSFFLASVSVSDVSYALALKVSCTFTLIISVLSFYYHFGLLKRTKSDNQNIVEEMEMMERYNKSKTKSPSYNNTVRETESLVKENSLEETDDLYEDAKNLVMVEGRASTSFLQRKLRIGYSRAARLMDMLEENKIVSAADGANARKILNGF